MTNVKKPVFSTMPDAPPAATAPSSAKIILWGTALSPYVRKVMVALAEKELTYQHKEILPLALLQATQQPVPPDFVAASPIGKVPALQVDNFTLADSTAITSYLDKRFAGKPLYPQDAEKFGKCVWFERYAEEVLGQVIHVKMMIESVVKPFVLRKPANREIIENARQVLLPPVLDYLDKTLADRLWLTGEHFSMADAAIANHLLVLPALDVSIDTHRWLHVARYLQHVLAYPAFASVIPALEALGRRSKGIEKK